MKQGPDNVLECPECKAPIIIFTLLSGNTVDARTWTDGKMIAPMFPQPPALTRCSECSHYFWLKDAKVLGEIPLWGPELENIPESWKKAARVRDLTESESLEALRTGAAHNRDQELYLRTCAWWAANDPLRSQNPDAGNSLQMTRSPETTANLRQLQDILEPENHFERLLKAEVMRELGQFSDAVALLQAEFPEALRKTAALIRELAQNNDPIVREVLE